MAKNIENNGGCERAVAAAREGGTASVVYTISELKLTSPNSVGHLRALLNPIVLRSGDDDDANTQLLLRNVLALGDLNMSNERILHLVETGVLQYWLISRSAHGNDGGVIAFMRRFDHSFSLGFLGQQDASLSATAAAVSSPPGPSPLDRTKSHCVNNEKDEEMIASVAAETLISWLASASTVSGDSSVSINDITTLSSTSTSTSTSTSGLLNSACLAHCNSHPHHRFTMTQQTRNHYAMLKKLYPSFSINIYPLYNNIL